MKLLNTENYQPVKPIPRTPTIFSLHAQYKIAAKEWSMKTEENSYEERSEAEGGYQSFESTMKEFRQQSKDDMFLIPYSMSQICKPKPHSYINEREKDIEYPYKVGARAPPPRDHL